MNSNKPGAAATDKQTFSELDLGPGCVLCIFGYVSFPLLHP